MKKKIIGIWGFGVVGKSAATYFLKQNYTVVLMDSRALTQEEEIYIKKNNIVFFQQTQIKDFFDTCDLFFPSPGIDITKHYATFKTKWVTELDVFSTFFKNQTIAVTGSIGKTSLVVALQHLLQDRNLFVGGNIGTPMLDLLIEEKQYTTALLELSSFQLEYAKNFQPSIAILTNIYPNHFDRHKNMQNYIKIKSNIFKHQIKNDFAIYPFCLHESISKYVSLQQRSFLFNQKKPDNCILQPNQTIVWIENEIIYLQSFKSQVKEIGTIHAHCPLFAETQMIIFIVGYILQYSTTNISNKINTIHIPPHRLEKLGNFNGIIIYNDSKSTTPACTQAAIEKLSSTCSRIHLIIGGLSKGIDRSFLFTYIATKKNIQVYLFGAEAETLFQMGLANNAPCKKENSLEKVVMLCKQNASKNDCILFSPAGSSFDLYANYIERGNHFKTIIKELFENTL